MTGPALATIAEARRIGLDLRADGDAIRFRPADRMTPDLAARLKAHKPAILAALAGTGPARRWLTEALSNGPRTQLFILEEGRKAGFKTVELRQSLAEIGGSHWHPWRMDHGGLWCPPD
ncbi:MAG TPA: hypothetical protein VNT79_09940 [Phycisphaerae bacterium]|nr:hypothetical protein [Phycisphaerae bacterium]